MAIPSFFKQNKPRGFNYTPRHYDGVKEEREARRRAMGLDGDSKAQGAGGTEQEAQNIEQELQNTSQKPYRRTITKGSMRDLYHHSRGSTRQHNSIRLIIILLILVLVTYLYLRF